MKSIKNIISVATFSLASFTASAASYDHLTILDSEGDSVPFSAMVRKPVGSLFNDVFGFTIGNSYNLDSGVQSQATLVGKKTFDLDITGFGIRNTQTNVNYSGNFVSGGQEDYWTIKNLILGAGTYELFVNGTVVGTGGGSYGGNFNVSPVPEPETYLMMLAGLAVIATTVSRRKKIGRRLAV